MSDIFADELRQLNSMEENDKTEEEKSIYIYVVNCEEQLDGEGVLPVRYMAEYSFDTPKEAWAFMAGRTSGNDKVKFQWGDESNIDPPVYVITNSMSCKRYDKREYEDRVEFAMNFWG